MDFAVLAKAALELGVIPALALFLVVAMHIQNKRLIAMLEMKDQHTFEILRMIVADVAEFKKKERSAGGQL